MNITNIIPEYIVTVPLEWLQTLQLHCWRGNKFSEAHSPSVPLLTALYIICRLLLRRADRVNYLSIARWQRQTLGLLSISMATVPRSYTRLCCGAGMCRTLTPDLNALGDIRRAVGCRDTNRQWGLNRKNMPNCVIITVSCPNHRSLDCLVSLWSAGYISALS